MTYKFDETDTIDPTRAAADTTKHLVQEDEIDNDHPGSEGDYADEYVAEGVVDHFVESGRPFYRVRHYGYSRNDGTL